jgi:hypothetical protein
MRALHESATINWSLKAIAKFLSRQKIYDQGIIMHNRYGETQQQVQPILSDFASRRGGAFVNQIFRPSAKKT